MRVGSRFLVTPTPTCPTHQGLSPTRWGGITTYVCALSKPGYVQCKSGLMLIYLLIYNLDHRQTKINLNMLSWSDCNCAFVFTSDCYWLFVKDLDTNPSQVVFSLIADVVNCLTYAKSLRTWFWRCRISQSSHDSSDIVNALFISYEHYIYIYIYIYICQCKHLLETRFDCIQHSDMYWYNKLKKINWLQQLNMSNQKPECVSSAYLIIVQASSAYLIIVQLKAHRH